MSPGVVSARDGLRVRSWWLARPWFFVAVVVLALNDHVLKSVWPGWLTGKLSDFAGLLVVATLVAVLSGPVVGMVVAGLAFVALKTVPGVAEFLAPVLGGGVSLRDASDLVALVVLPPLWWVLCKERPDQAGRTRRGWVAVGLVAGVLATTATTPVESDVVQSLGWQGATVYVTVPLGGGLGTRYLQSTDGGRFWTSADANSQKLVHHAKADADGNTTACAADGTCYRLHEIAETAKDHHVFVERQAPGSGVWSRELELNGFIPKLKLAVTESGAAVVSEGERTIRYRVDAATWPATDVVALAQPPQVELDLLAVTGSPWASVAIAILLMLLAVILEPTPNQRILGVVVNLTMGFVMFVGLVLVLIWFGGEPVVAAVNTIWFGTTLAVLINSRVKYRRQLREARSETITP